MLGLPVEDVMEKRLLIASPETTVGEAARLMKNRKVGAVLVVQQARLLGIFTERDAVYRVMAQGRDPEATRLAEVMTPKPKTVAPDDTFGYAMLMMYEQRFRHAPVVAGDRLVGIVSARNALDPDLEEFTAEAQRRQHLRRRA